MKLTKSLITVIALASEYVHRGYKIGSREWLAGRAGRFSFATNNKAAADRDRDVSAALHESEHFTL